MYACASEKNNITIIILVATYVSALESVSMGTVDALVASLPPSDYRLIEIAGIIIIQSLKMK